MRLTPRYGSHLPVLMKAVEATTGDILELGMGVFSTPYLHWHCVIHKRHLASYDDQQEYYDMFEEYEHEYHKVRLVADWDKLDICREWDVALIDHTPAGRRRDDILKLADYAKYIVVHDSGWRGEKHYHLKEIWGRFKYKYTYTDTKPKTTMVSNLVDLEGFKI